MVPVMGDGINTREVNSLAGFQFFRVCHSRERYIWLVTSHQRIQFAALTESAKSVLLRVSVREPDAASAERYL
jgi:hypothetical protein